MHFSNAVERVRGNVQQKMIVMFLRMANVKSLSMVLQLNWTSTGPQPTTTIDSFVFPFLKWVFNVAVGPIDVYNSSI